MYGQQPPAAPYGYNPNFHQQAAQQQPQQYGDGFGGGLPPQQPPQQPPPPQQYGAPGAPQLPQVPLPTSQSSAGSSLTYGDGAAVASAAAMMFSNDPNAGQRFFDYQCVSARPFCAVSR